MYSKEKKLNLIEYLLKESNEKVLAKVEELLAKSAKEPSKNIKLFKSTLTKKEVEELEKNIKEGCEQID